MDFKLNDKPLVNSVNRTLEYALPEVKTCFTWVGSHVHKRSFKLHKLTVLESKTCSVILLVDDVGGFVELFRREVMLLDEPFDFLALSHL